MPLGFALLGLQVQLGFCTTGFHTTGFHTTEFVQPGQQFEALFLLMNRNSQWWLLLMFCNCKVMLMKLLRKKSAQKVENVLLFLPFFQFLFFKAKIVKTSFSDIYPVVYFLFSNETRKLEFHFIIKMHKTTSKYSNTAV